jgi:hypothetical protein
MSVRRLFTKTGDDFNVRGVIDMSTIIDLLEGAKLLAGSENNLMLAYLIEMAQQEAREATAQRPKKRTA